MDKVPAITTRDALGTPAIPLLVNISTSNMVNWVERERGTSYACAIKSDANPIYSILPSRLKEYPRGKTKLTIFFGQPDCSSSSISLGNAASELAVVKAS